MSKAFRAKAEREIRGDHVLQYSMLRDYVVELQSTNPNTTVKIAVERNTDPSLPTRVFQRIYVCLGALKLGFRACRRDLLGLDGAFMKGPFPGQVLVAVGLDSNNGIYPLAYALVEAETKSSWCWFLQCLGDDIDLHPNSNFTFISDRQKGIIPAIKTVYPSAEHRYCLRHIHENMKQGWCGQAYKDLLWRAASATNVRDFEKCMLELKTMNPKAHEWLNKIPAEHWARSHFQGQAVDSHFLVTSGVPHERIVNVQELTGIHCGNNAEGSGSASRQAQQTEPAVGQDGSGGSGAGVVIGLSAAAGEGGAGDPGGAGVASQGSSHTRWTRRRVQTERISPQKRTPTQPANQPSTSSQVPVSQTRNADGREMGDGVPTQSSAAGGAGGMDLF
ncbi:mutator type transposase [Tanacetum coccineum]